MIIVWLCLAVSYVCFAVVAAYAERPRVWKAARARHSYWYEKYDIRPEVRCQVMAAAVFWPAVLGYRTGVRIGHRSARALDRFIDAGDPEQHKPPAADLRAGAWMNEMTEKPPVVLPPLYGSQERMRPREYGNDWNDGPR